MSKNVRSSAGPLASGLLLAIGCGTSGPPTFSGEVAELLHEECAACHRPEGMAPFPLLTYQDAAPRAALIAAAVASGRMPPWLPSIHTPTLEGERRLSEGQVEMLAAWSAAGAPRGDAAEEPPPPSFPGGWQLGEPDLVLEMPAPFTVAAGGEDVFRNFLLTVPLAEGRWVRAVELVADNYAPLHHGVIRVDETSSSRLAEEADTVPGFDEMFSVSSSHPPGEFFLGWTPGLVPSAFPEGMAWRLEPGTDMVVNLHLMPMPQLESFTVRLGLHFTEEAPTVRSTLLRLGSNTIDIPAGDSAYVVRDSITLPAAARVVAVYPHAHFLAEVMEVWAETPDGERRTLMDIPRWNFNWQDSYRYREPIPLPAGAEVHLRYVYDNSAANPLNPNTPPRRVVYGPRSGDEMAEFFVQVVPEDPTQLTVLREAFDRKYFAATVRGWEHLVSLDPDDAEAQFALGVVAHERGDLDGAEQRFRRALEAQPEFSRAHHRLARVLEDRGHTEAALRAYREAVDGPAENLPALRDYGVLLSESGDPASAEVPLARVVEVDPADAGARNNLGRVMLVLGRFPEAVGHLEQAVKLEPRLAAARFNLAFALIQAGRVDAGVRALNDGLALDGGNVASALTVAWMLATDVDPAVRRPALAVELAEEIRQATGPHPASSDVLAAALAAAGRFSLAARVMEEALAEARRRGETELLPGLESRARLYRAGRPYLDAARGVPTPPTLDPPDRG